MSDAPSFAEVVVGADDVRGVQTFHYKIPASLRDQVRLGQLVLVPFGTRQSHAIVMALADASPVEVTRPIIDVIPGLDRVGDRHVELARWTAEHYASPVLDAIGLVLPPRLSQYLRSTYVPTANDVDVHADLAPSELRALAMIRDRGEMSDTEIRQLAGKTFARVGIRKLEAAGLVNRRIFVKLPRLPGVRVASALGPPGQDSADVVLARAPKQRALWHVLNSACQPIVVSEALLAADARASHLNGLVSRGMARVQNRNARPYLATPRGGATWPLSMGDEDAWSVVRTCLERREPVTVLLQGGENGRWQIYLQSIAHVLERRCQALVIVPDKNSAMHLAEWLAMHVDAIVAVQGRARTDAERVALWRELQAGHVDVLVGTRSACFAPLPSLGLVVVDREEDVGHKNRHRPRFHARNVARRLAELNGCALVLGAETPSVEAFHDVEADRSQLVIVRPADEPQAIGSCPSSSVKLAVGQTEVIDMTQAVTVGRHGVISRSMFQTLRRTLQAGKQAVLYVNRRGTAALTVCRDCGNVFDCPRCSTGLVHHHATKLLQCHVCNWREDAPTICPACGGNRLRLWGYGSEAVAEAVSRLLPKAHIARIDSDRRDNEVEADVSAFTSRAGIEVLVGTQRLIGFRDSLRAGLLGIVQADVGLQFPDFLAPERVYTNLMRLQGLVMGGGGGGCTVIQTLVPDHHVIEAVRRRSYLHFYRTELAQRKAEGLPPFRPIARATYADSDNARAETEAHRARREIETIARANGAQDLEVLGPAPAALRRLHGKYVWQLLLLGEDARRLLPELHRGWTVDIDPIALTLS